MHETQFMNIRVGESVLFIQTIHSDNWMDQLSCYYPEENLGSGNRSSACLFNVKLVW